MHFALFLGVLFNLENISGCVFNFRYNYENIIGRFIVCVYVCVCLSMDLVQGKMYSLWIMVKIVWKSLFRPYPFITRAWRERKMICYALLTWHISSVLIMSNPCAALGAWIWAGLVSKVGFTHTEAWCKSSSPTALWAPRLCSPPLCSEWFSVTSECLVPILRENCSVCFSEIKGTTVLCQTQSHLPQLLTHIQPITSYSLLWLQLLGCSHVPIFLLPEEKGDHRIFSLNNDLDSPMPFWVIVTRFIQAIHLTHVKKKLIKVRR